MKDTSRTAVPLRHRKSNSHSLCAQNNLPLPHTKPRPNLLATNVRMRGTVNVPQMIGDSLQLDHLNDGLRDVTQDG
jgi:hypothetical protein